jgi:hypothetical protein
VEGRKDISAFAIQFKEENVPIRYKIIINDYLRQQKHKPSASQQKPVVENPLPPPPAWSLATGLSPWGLLPP